MCEGRGGNVTIQTITTIDEPVSKCLNIECKKMRLKWKEKGGDRGTPLVRTICISIHPSGSLLHIKTLCTLLGSTCMKCGILSTTGDKILNQGEEEE